MTEPVTISSARPDEWPAAFALALQYVPDEQRPTRVANAQALLDAGEIDAAGIFVARIDDKVVGVQVCIPLRGRSALFWLPQVEPSLCTRQPADELVQAALHWARQRGAKLAQALIHPSDLPNTDPLIHCGFEHITDLLYMSHNLQDPVPVPAFDELRFESFRPAIEPIFQQTLLRTYDGTLDCPELDGIRSIEEVLDGHRAQGIWHPEAWWLARVGEKPAGIVMLTEMPDSDGWDMSYIGLAPEFRQRGLGKALAIHAMQAAAKWKAARLTLAVDQRNVPAVRLYETLGFQGSGRRSVLLQVF